MKRILVFFVFFPGLLRGQTISVGPVAPLAYCQGNSLTVSYSASGSFAADNFFTVQLSDSMGSFASFVNVGHDTARTGSFKVKLPWLETNLRVRVASTDPYLWSNDNGSDISVYALPPPQIGIKNLSGKMATSSIIGFAGDDFQLWDAGKESPGSTYRWQFDSAAGVPVGTDSAVQVTFPLDGATMVKLYVTNPNDCTDSASASYTLLSCSPEIPKGATVISGAADGIGGWSVVELKAGANLTGVVKWSTVFAEPGSSISGAIFDVGTVYLESGASFAPDAGEEGADNHNTILM